MRSLLALALIAGTACGTRLILETRIDQASRGADDHVTVNASLSCDTMMSYPSCVSLGDYCMQARWESPTATDPIDTVEECHANALTANGAVDSFALRSTIAIPSDPTLRIRVTARLKNPTGAAYQIYDAAPVPCP